MREEAKLAKRAGGSPQKAGGRNRPIIPTPCAILTPSWNPPPPRSGTPSRPKRPSWKPSWKRSIRSSRTWDYRAANQRAGYVYVISNIGAFGENVYKIGMTRRLNPMDRVDELGRRLGTFRL